MKIFVDAHKFDHSLQGTSTYIKGIYNSLVKFDDVEITLCAENIDNLKLHFQDTRFNFLKLNASSKYKRLAIEYPRLLSQGGFDFAHFQYIVPPIKMCKYINTIHDLLFLDFKEYFPWSYRFTNGSLFKVSARYSDILLTVSQYSKEAIASHYGTSLDKIYITNNAVNSPQNDYVAVKDKYQLRKYILFVSRFEPRKNHLMLLKAYLEDRLYESDIDLVFIGSKKESIEIQAYQELINNIPLNLKHHVKFYEGVPEKELNSFYHHASCFVFPSLAEGFGIPPLEAAINGTKVLCSNSTAMADFDFFKYQFNPLSLEDLKSKLLAILNDNEYPYEDIKFKIQSKYNWDSIANEYHQVLSKYMLKE